MMLITMQLQSNLFNTVFLKTMLGSSLQIDLNAQPIFSMMGFEIRSR